MAGSEIRFLLQNGTCIVAGGSEAQNQETQELAARVIGCKPFNRTALHVQAGAIPRAVLDYTV